MSAIMSDSHNNQADEETADSIIARFDSICVSFGDQDCIQLPNGDSMFYLQLQECSTLLAAQLHYRFRPDYVLLDLQGHAAAEAVAILACIRLGIPFVPVSVRDQHVGGRLSSIVGSLRPKHVVAIACCENDKDPMLAVFQKADVHQILYLDPQGNMKEALDVPEQIALPERPHFNDDLYIMFTSGTSSDAPKAVKGSHRSTLKRLDWFANTFDQSPMIARRTKLTFVDSIAELFGALLFPPSILYAMDPQELRERGIASILDTPCSQVTLLPSQLSQLLMACDVNSPCRLDRIIISGEPCPPNLLELVTKTLPHAALINLYGQTETTGDVLCAVLTDMDEPIVNGIVAVGKPMGQDTVIVASPGSELIVQGNLSNGYLNEPPLEEFHTGDVGFFHNENWYVQGRIDEVIKINGILTSPSEVEAAFANLYNVGNVAASIVEQHVYVLVDQPVHFSREYMTEKGVPFHLIPREVLVVEAIPTSDGGAGKVNRKQVRSIVVKWLGMNKTTNTSTKSEADFHSLLRNLLDVDIDESKSFVELGGDSAKAVTFLYLLRSASLVKGDLTAVEILTSNCIKELHELVEGKGASKRQRPNHRKPQMPWRPKPIKRYSTLHYAVEFRACVDATPCVMGEGKVIFGACQGGVIQRIANETVVAFHDMGDDWGVQAGMIDSGSFLLINSYNCNDDNVGRITAFDIPMHTIMMEGFDCLCSEEVKLTEVWRVETEGGIKVSPSYIGDFQMFVSAGEFIYRRGHGDETFDDNFPLGFTPVAKPAEICLFGESAPEDELAAACAPADMTQCEGDALVYANPEWDAPLKIVFQRDAEHLFFDSIPLGSHAPILEDLDTHGSELRNVIACDRAGWLYRIDAKTKEFTKEQISSVPLTAPVVVLDKILIGSNDGWLRCCNANNLSELLWEFDAGACMYCKPLVIPSTPPEIVVCTTAGDVIRLQEQGDAGVLEIWRCRIQGEIWSTPVWLNYEENCDNMICFGARDSRLHVMKLGGPRILLNYLD